jgi:hypothetical protein
MRQSRLLSCCVVVGLAFLMVIKVEIGVSTVKII